MKIADYVILGLILAYAVFTAVWMIRRKRQGKHLCCGSCAGCGGCDRCAERVKSDETEKREK